MTSNGYSKLVALPDDLLDEPQLPSFTPQWLGKAGPSFQDGSRQPPATPPEPEHKDRKRAEGHAQANGEKWAPQAGAQPVPPPARGGKWRGQDEPSFVPPHRREQRGWSPHHQEETPRWMQEAHGPTHGNAHPVTRWQDTPQAPAEKWMPGGKGKGGGGGGGGWGPDAPRWDGMERGGNERRRQGPAENGVPWERSSLMPGTGPGFAMGRGRGLRGPPGPTGGVGAGWTPQQPTQAIGASAMLDAPRPGPRKKRAYTRDACIRFYRAQAASGGLGAPPGFTHPDNVLRPGSDHPTPMDVLAGTHKAGPDLAPEPTKPSDGPFKKTPGADPAASPAGDDSSAHTSPDQKPAAKPSAASNDALDTKASAGEAPAALPDLWCYQDPHGILQGPFPKDELVDCPFENPFLGGPKSPSGLKPPSGGASVASDYDTHHDGFGVGAPSESTSATSDSVSRLATAVDKADAIVPPPPRNKERAPALSKPAPSEAPSMQQDISAPRGQSPFAQQAQQVVPEVSDPAAAMQLEAQVATRQDSRDGSLDGGLTERGSEAKMESAMSSKPSRKQRRKQAHQAGGSKDELPSLPQLDKPVAPPVRGLGPLGQKPPVPPPKPAPTPMEHVQAEPEVPPPSRKEVPATVAAPWANSKAGTGKTLQEIQQEEARRAEIAAQRAREEQAAQAAAAAAAAASAASGWGGASGQSKIPTLREIQEQEERQRVQVKQAQKESGVQPGRQMRDLLGPTGDPITARGFTLADSLKLPEKKAVRPGWGAPARPEDPDVSPFAPVPKPPKGKTGATAPQKRPAAPMPEPTDDDDELLWDYGQAQREAVPAAVPTQPRPAPLPARAAPPAPSLAQKLAAQAASSRATAVNGTPGGAGTSKGMPATPRKMGVAGSSAAESPGATNAQQVAVDSLGLNIQISSEMEAWWKAQMAKLKGEGGVEMLQFLMSLPSPPDVLDTLRAYFPSLPASSLQGLTNELFRRKATPGQPAGPAAKPAAAAKPDASAAAKAAASKASGWAKPSPDLGKIKSYSESRKVFFN
ncbi:hypothetical protein WJX84_001558 [Apatococcus fuscideae]|uniref:GYF domain-containing protein n=2 Tax=Apatococcus fuscideae TaxID=2026836 RepID=A0AAW1SZ91_9CHLO